MKIIIQIILIYLVGCSDQNIDDSHIHDDIVQRDLTNKQYELDVLRELYIAQLNNDEDAFVYYVTEYVRIPRLELNIEQKSHPRYKPWITDDIIKSGEFMDAKYNYK